MKWVAYGLIVFGIVGLMVVEQSRYLVADVTHEEVPSAAPADMMTASELQPAAKIQDLPFNVFMELR